MYRCFEPSCAFQSDANSLFAHLRIRHGKNLTIIKCPKLTCPQTSKSVEGMKKHCHRFHPEIFKKASKPASFSSGDVGTSEMQNLTLYQGNECLEESHLEYTSESNEITVENVHENLAYDIILYFLRARDLFSLPHSTAFSLTLDLLSIIRKFTSDFVQLTNGISTGLKPDLDILFDLSIDKLLSDGKIHQVLLENFSYHPPIEHDFSNSKHKLYQISLRDTLQMYFSNPHRAICLLNSPQDPFFQSRYFLDKIQPLGDEAIYLALYSDEFELVNPIGNAKKKHKLVAVYFMVLNTPLQFRSEVENIFLLSLGKQILVDEIGLEAFFSPLIDELNELYFHGIDINGKNIPVIAAFMSGDNLSIHAIMGLGRSFSSGNICRFCNVTFSDLKTHTGFDCSEIKSHVTYDQDFINKRLQGINVSPFYNLVYVPWPHFFPPDIMHDMLEGVSHVVLAVVLRHLILHNISDIESINIALQSFDWGLSLPNLTKYHVKNMHFPMTASQTKHVLLHFPLIFGHKVCSDNPPLYWELLLLHHELLTIVLSSRHIAPLDYVKLIVSRHDSLIYELCLDNPKCKCKLHYLKHYPELLYYYNGLKLFWTMRFESRHKYFKQLSRTVKQYKNISYTLAYRFQIRSCLLNYNFQGCQTTPGILMPSSIGEVLDFEEMNALKKFLAPCELSVNEVCQVTDKVECKYEIKCQKTVILYDFNHAEYEPKFCYVEKIMLIRHEWMFVCYSVDAHFVSHLRSFVLKTRSLVPFFLKALDLLHAPLPIIHIRCCKCVVLPTFPI